LVRSSQELLNLIRISDSFFPLGSYAVSQGVEQMVAENLLKKEELPTVLSCYLQYIWQSFDLPMFHSALGAVQRGDLDMVRSLDELCHSSKLSAESRNAMGKMGTNLIRAVNFPPETLGSRYKGLVEDGSTAGMYPVALAVVSAELGFNEQGAVSLIYVNLMEVVASLVRMVEIDYLDAQQLMSDGIDTIEFAAHNLNNAHQSFPFIEIAAMRHERNQSRMFMS
jgi:urease accessory protein